MAFGRFRRAYRALKQRRIDPRLGPPTAAELGDIERLRAEFRALPVYDPEGVPGSTAEWQLNLNDLRNDVLELDPRRFTRFKVVLKTMFVHEAGYLPLELKYLQDHRDWATHWQRVVRESGTGHPPRYEHYTETSGNLIHHCYHLARFSDATGCDPAALDFVLEFGGGYGGMCRVLHQRGFKGRYVIFDFPHFSALQRFFLRSIGVTVHDTVDAFRAAKEGVLCVSDFTALDAVLPGSLARSLFIATWSLSETPASLREELIGRVARFSAFMVAFQDRFNEMDNQAYFGGPWKQATGADVRWHLAPLPHIPGNSYLFGLRT